MSSLVYRVHSINLEKACEEEKVRQEWPHDQDTSSPHHHTAPGSQSATDLSVINVPEVAISNPGMAKNSDNDL